MTLVLLKRDDGTAWIFEVNYYPDGSHSEGSDHLSADDVIDGKRVADWPAGVHTVKKLARAEVDGE